MTLTAADCPRIAPAAPNNGQAGLARATVHCPSAAHARSLAPTEWNVGFGCRTASECECATPACKAPDWGVVACPGAARAPPRLATQRQLCFARALRRASSLAPSPCLPWGYAWPCRLCRKLTLPTMARTLPSCRRQRRQLPDSVLVCVPDVRITTRRRHHPERVVRGRRVHHTEQLKQLKLHRQPQLHLCMGGERGCAGYGPRKGGCTRLPSLKLEA